jgi:AAA+ ATPase superfamily predicted ATPase
MKTINGHDVPSKEEIKNKTADIEKTISRTAGISNVKTTVDFDNYIIGITCNFNKVTQINDAVKNIYLKENPKGKASEKIYDYNAVGNLFTRLNLFSFKDEYKKLSNADKEVFATANYTSILKFEGTVMQASNKETKISPSKKAVMLKLNALDIITEKKSIENKITLTK